jgi:subtilase family serine protease
MVGTSPLTLRFCINHGTSAATPIFASIIYLLNEERIAVGKKPIGFLNQILYAHPEVFNDITEGYNLGCNAQHAFNATKAGTLSQGWELLTFQR